MSIQPLILAGGLGTRLRPRTKILPKPLLPVAGRPLLWYVLQALAPFDLAKPIVAVSYLGKTITAYFEGWPATFEKVDCPTMADAVLSIASRCADSQALLGMSSDVIVPRVAVRQVLEAYKENGGLNTVLFVRLAEAGHKKWNFIVSDRRLVDIKVEADRTAFERVLLILNVSSVKQLTTIVGNPIVQAKLDADLLRYQAGWNLILKALLRLEIPVAAEYVDTPVCNINRPEDFPRAEDFVRNHGPWE